MDSSYIGALQKIAMECTLRRRSRKCRRNFDSYECNKCDYYVKNYIDADPAQIKLFMVNTNFEAGKMLTTSRRLNWGIVGWLLLLVGFVGGVIYLLGPVADRNKAEWLAKANAYSVANNVASKPTTNDIERTLQQVALNMKDVNNDGLINCIDAAVLFYQYYPDKSKVTISLNRNDATGMNHLFNVVLVDGVWRAVEPQTYYTNNTAYWMRDAWGSKYDSSLNKVVTKDYLKYVK